MAEIVKKLSNLNKVAKRKFTFLKCLNNDDEQIDRELKAIDETRTDLYKVNREEHYTVHLHIEKSKEQAFYLTIKNMSTYDDAFKQLSADIDVLMNKIQDYLGKYKQLPEDIQKPITHLIKYLEMFQRRLDAGKKINDSNFNSTSDYREAAREKLSELFRSYFISKCMQAINDGFRVESKKQYYKEIAKIFNAFLQKQGIYTRLFLIYDEIDFELLIPESKTTTDNSELNGKIAELYMLPYFFNDPNYNGHALISEGSCVAYSTQ